MRGASYIKNAAILTVTGLFLRAAGMVFRIYVAGRIGAEGMGLYQLIFSVYSMAVTLSTGGLTICATFIVTDSLSYGGGTYKAMRKILTLALTLGTGIAIILFSASGVLSRLVLSDVRAAVSLRVLAPSLPFMALSAVMRGYFIAKRRVGPNARAQIAEQLIRIALVACIFYLRAPQNTAAACAAVLLGNTVSESCSWIYMSLCYRRDKALTTEKNSTARPLHLWHLLLPISANMYLTAFLRAVENVMVPACLTGYDMQRETALAQYGALKGMAMPVIFFPFSFLATLSTLLIPEITEAFVLKRHEKLEYLVKRVLEITCSLSVLTGCIFTLFAGDIGDILYHDASVSFYIRVLAPLMPIMYLESMVDGILKGMDEQIATFKYSIADSCIRIALIAFLLPRYGMKGFLFVMVLSNLFTGLLNVKRLLHVTQIRFDWVKWAIKPLISCLGVGFCLHFVLRPMVLSQLPQIMGIVISGLVSCVIYFTVLWTIGGFSLADIIPPRKTDTPNNTIVQ